MDNYEVEEESEVQDKMQDKFPEVSKPTWDVFDIIHPRNHQGIELGACPADSRVVQVH
jgi:hypothetical protein